MTHLVSALEPDVPQYLLRGDIPPHGKPEEVGAVAYLTKTHPQLISAIWSAGYQKHPEVGNTEVAVV